MALAPSYASLLGSGLNQAGTGTDGNSGTNDIASALNYYGIKDGSITSPSASVIASADSYTATNANTDDHPVRSATGQWVSSQTGQAWHGAYHNPNGQTQYYSNGLPVSDIGQVGNATPNISVQQIEKNPAISGQVSGQVNANAANTGMLGKSFQQYLQEAQGTAAQVPGQLTAAESAINPAGTTGRMNADVANSTANLNNTLNQYAAAQGANQANIAAANQNYAATQGAALTNLGTTLNTQQNDYAKAAQDVAAQGFANALKATNLYQLGTGTPTSGSGALSNRYLADYNNINLPLQQQLAAMRMGTTNQLYNQGSNLQQQYLANLMGQYQGQGALNSDLATRGVAANQYTTGLDQGTAQYLQSLQQQVATMQPQLALSYLQSIGIPIQMAQQIISGNTSNLAGLTALDQNANAYNFLTPYQNNAPQYLTTSNRAPNYGTQNYTGNNGGSGFGPLVSQVNSALADPMNQPTGYGPGGNPSDSYVPPSQNYSNPNNPLYTQTIPGLGLSLAGTMPII
jgi:hypothetical protein